MSGAASTSSSPKDGDDVAASSGSSLARDPVPQSSSEGRPGTPQPRVQVINQYCSEEAGLTSSQEVNPQPKFRSCKANEG